MTDGSGSRGVARLAGLASLCILLLWVLAFVSPALRADATFPRVYYEVGCGVFIAQIALLRLGLQGLSRGSSRAANACIWAVIALLVCSLAFVGLEAAVNLQAFTVHACVPGEHDHGYFADYSCLEDPLGQRLYDLAMLAATAVSAWAVRLVVLIAARIGRPGSSGGASG